MPDDDIISLCIAGVIFAAMIAYKKYLNRVEAKKIPKLSKEDAWINPINTGFDEWLEELKHRR